MKRQLLMTAAILLIALPAFATLAPPVKISREGERSFATAGLEYRGSFLIETKADLEIELVELEGEGWTGTYLSASPVLAMVGEDSQSVEFGGTPSADAGDLYLVYTVNGKAYRKSLDPGPRRSIRLMEPRAEIYPSEKSTVVKVQADPNADLAPLPMPARQARQTHLKTVTDESHDIDENDKSDKSRTITVTGRVVFTEPSWELGDETIPTQSKGARGATASVWDEDSTWDEHLGSDLTDENGYFSVTFDWDPCWGCDGTPDLYVQVNSGNTRIVVESAWFEIDYFFSTPTWDDYTGSSLNVGTIAYADEEEQATLFMVSHLTRAYYMIRNVGGREQPYVEVQYPGEGAFYATLFEEIHMDLDRSFVSGSIVHEYGHHYIEIFGDTGDTDTCNDVCDTGSWVEGIVGSCGHCRWCAESEDVAWSEGWPQWLADYYSRYHLNDYGVWPRGSRLFEVTQDCNVTEVVESFKATEGRVAAFIRDIEDDNNENDPVSPGFMDALSQGGARVFEVTALDDPTDVFDYFSDYQARYSPPEPEFWQTARNAGFPNYDFTGPSAPPGFESQTHTVGVPFFKNRIFLNWDASVDDISGVEKYRYSFSEGAAASPDTNMLGTTNLFGKSNTLTPGTWYANIIVKDNAGNWSPVTSLGPFIITDPPDPDLAFWMSTGWDEPLIPHNLNTLDDGNVPEPIYLVGNASSTYWNYSVASVGHVAILDSTEIQVFVDGEEFPFRLPPSTNWDTQVVPFIGEAPKRSVNRGPVWVRGGRHVFSAWGDVNDVVAESDEDNNVWGRSWVWAPAPLTEDVDFIHGSPPDIIGGWEDITSGSLYFNCDGLRFTSSGWWNAVTLVPELPGSDFDVRLHDPSSGATNGFYSPLGWSSRGDGLTDAVLVNRNWVGDADWDVAVWPGNSDNDPGSYKARHVTSTSFTFGDSIGVAMGDGEVLTLHELYVAPADTGLVQVIVRTDPAQGPLWVSFFDAGFVNGDLLDDEAGGLTDENGFCRLQVTAPVAHYYGVVVYRDATDGNGVAPENFSLQIGLPSPDVMAYTPPGWSRPLIPWEDTDDLNGPIPTPTTLNGWDETWVHSATINTSPRGTAGVYVQTLGVDGSTLGSPLLSGGFAGSDSLKGANATEVPGGRHTLWMRAEWPEWQSEDPQPANNYWAEQWVWTPQSMALDTPRAFAHPDDPTGGWDKDVNPAHVGQSASFFYNCTGLRTPVYQAVGSTGHWAAVAATPTDSLGDIDVRLHDELSTGAQSGFAQSILTSSAGGRGQTEFAVFHPGGLGENQLDVGVLQGSQADPAAGDFKAMTVASSYLGVDGVTPSGTFGLFSLPAGQQIELFEIWLDAGDHSLTLDNLSGGANLGLSLHGGGDLFARASEDSSSGTAWLEPAGADETLLVLVETSGYHAVAVWKAGWDDLELATTFNLVISSGGISGTLPGVPGLQTRIESVQPNPFNPQTMVAFTVQETGTVEVAVYDLRGQRVRTLHHGELGQGRHQRVWDGRDEHGRNAATGTYLVRLRGGGTVDHRKIMLLK